MNVEMFIVLERIPERKYYENVLKRLLTESPTVHLFVSVHTSSFMFIFYYIDELTNFVESGVKHHNPQNGHNAYCE
jgi:hypothetical protein